MTLLKRLHNLWLLSEFEVPKIGEKPEHGTIVAQALYKKPESSKMAIIIKRNKDAVKEILNEQ